MTWPLGTFIERYKDAILEVGLGRTYGHTDNASQDCVRLQYAALEKLWGTGVVKPLSRQLHLNGYPLGSIANCRALVDAGMGDWVEEPEVGGVYYVQVWRKDGSGHCYVLLYYPGPVDQPLWILEATNSNRDRDEDGVKDRYDWYRAADWDDLQKDVETLGLVRLRDPLT